MAMNGCSTYFLIQPKDAKYYPQTSLPEQAYFYDVNIYNFFIRLQQNTLYVFELEISA